MEGICVLRGANANMQIGLNEGLGYFVVTKDVE